MKYLNPDGFSVVVGSKEYRDNWEATFGEPEPRVEAAGNVAIDITPPGTFGVFVPAKHCKHCGRELNKYGICPDL